MLLKFNNILIKIMLLLFLLFANFYICIIYNTYILKCLVKVVDLYYIQNCVVVTYSLLDNNNNNLEIMHLEMNINLIKNKL